MVTSRATSAQWTGCATARPISCRRHRRGGGAAGRQTCQPCHQLRHPVRHRVLLHRIGRTGAGPPARRSCSSPRANGACCVRSKRQPGSRSSRWTPPSVHDINPSAPNVSRPACARPSRARTFALYYRLVSESLRAGRDRCAADRRCAGQAGAGRRTAAARSQESRRPARRADLIPLDRDDRERRPARPERQRPQKSLKTQALPLKDFPEVEMVRYRVAVGYQQTGQGAIATRPT